MFDDVWWFFITYDMDHVASMSSSRTFRTSWHIHAHNIYIQHVLSIFWLAVMWAHWKTPAHGSEVMPARDSVWMKWRRTWRNCALGQTSGQSRAELLAPWKYFVIVKAMEDKHRAHRGRKFWCWSEFRSFKQTKGLSVEGQKRFVHRHCFGTP